METEQLDDTIVAAKNGDRQALGLLIDTFAEPIHSFIFYTIGRSSDVDDLAQDTFVKMITNINQYQPTAPFKAWLFRIALNVCRDHLRKKKVRRIISPLLPDHRDEEIEIKSNTIAPDVEVVLKDSLKHMHQAIQQLPEQLKTVLLMRDVQDLTYDEIANALNWHMGTVKSRLNRARSLLAHQMNKSERSKYVRK